MREIVNGLTPGFLKPYVNKVLPINSLPQLGKVIGLGTWGAVGGVFAFFLVQDPAFVYVKSIVKPPPEESE
eukprot:CAMPEP_0182610706 /NCGR_PEP_ID=MMETSP1330-20130603/9883_1 /TAXON_ID=464278 /ORGANISM="Picochlorum sp., Strain RCC944" /LENGTH=70 /DNA_ID=CAMNT_0024829959 /DNA_START=90 /DNA_END=299 /DNA_ORIENTATION=+